MKRLFVIIGICNFINSSLLAIEKTMDPSQKQVIKCSMSKKSPVVYRLSNSIDVFSITSFSLTENTEKIGNYRRYKGSANEAIFIATEKLQSFPYKFLIVKTDLLGRYWNPGELVMIGMEDPEGKKQKLLGYCEATNLK